MVMAVVSDEVAVIDDPPGRLWLRPDPAALEEEGGAHARVAKGIQDALGVAGWAERAVGMLGIEGERDPGAIPTHAW